MTGSSKITANDFIPANIHNKKASASALKHYREICCMLMLTINTIVPTKFLDLILSDYKRLQQ